MRPIVIANACALLALLTGTVLAGVPEAQALYDRGEYEDAIKALTPVLRKQPGDAAALLLLGRCQMGERLDAEAVDTLEEAVKQAPDSAAAQYALGQALANRVTEVSVLRQGFMAGEMRTAFLRAVELQPANVDYHEALFDFYRQAPELVGGGMDKARAEAQTLAKLDAAAGHRAAAALALADGKPDRAEAEYHAAIAAAPGNPDAYFELGLMHQRDQRYGEAFKDFDALLKNVPGYMPGEFQLGKTAALSGSRLQDGEAAFKRYLAHNPAPDEPPLARAHARLAELYQKMKRITEARAEFQAALALDPSLDEAKKGLAALPR